MKWVGLILLSLLIIGLSLGLGSIDLWTLSPDTTTTILLSLRLPRVINALLVGGCLAMAGAIFQGIFQNPLADPYVLGVSSGAALGACLALLIGISGWGLGIPAATFIGALVATLIVYAMIEITKASIPQFILSGIMLNAFFSSLNLIVLYLSDSKIRNMMIWMMGDLGNTALSPIFIGVALALTFGLIAYKLAPRINLIALGDSFAQSTGVPVKSTRLSLFICASALTGIAVACGGVIGFVGLVVPHSIRLLKKDNFSHLLPLSAWAGAIFLCLADLISRTLLPQTDLPVGILTSLIGAPFFMWLLLQKSRRAS